MELDLTRKQFRRLLDMVFSPDDTILLGGDSLPSFSAEGEDMLGEALPPRTYRRNPEELDALLGGLSGLGSMGFDITDEESENAKNDEEDQDEE